VRRDDVARGAFLWIWAAGPLQVETGDRGGLADVEANGDGVAAGGGAVGPAEWCVGLVREGVGVVPAEDEGVEHHPAAGVGGGHGRGGLLLVGSRALGSRCSNEYSFAVARDVLHCHERCTLGSDYYF
jgi:hypothetical protein